ncbi:MAG: FecR family protein, partial [Burkholderiales bacterium]
MRWTIASILLGFALAAGAQEAGEIKTVAGTASLERDGKTLPVRAGMPVRQSDTVVTGADGAVGITFTDNSLLSVGPNSALVIDRYSFDSTTHRGEFDTSLRKGTLAVISGKIVKQSPDAMRVRTPT